MKSFPIKPGPAVIAVSALALVALAVAIPIVWKPAAFRPAGTDGSTPPGAHGTARPPEPKPGPTVFRFFQENPTNLDAALASDAYSSTVIAQIYSPLVGLTSSLEPTPQAADSWTISRDGLTYVFHIREGVRFHNGRAVTAGDFAFSLTRVFTEPFLSEGLAAGYLDAIEGVPEFIGGKAKAVRGIQVLDDRRLRIHLSRPYRPLLTALALDQTSAVPREVLEARGKQALEVTPVGCGPFRFVRREGAQGVVLAANPDYFMGRPAIDTLIFHAPQGDVTSLGADALLDGRATLSALPADRIEEFRARRGITMLRWQDLSLAFLGMNATIKPLDDPRVRRAIALAVDRQAMLDLQPEGKTLAQGILPPGLPGYTPIQKTYPHDVARARALLTEAGFGPENPLPKLRLYRRSTTNAKTLQVDSLMVRSLAAAGIPVETRYVTWAVLDRLITARKAPMFALSWVADIPDPDTFLRALFYSSSGTNYFRYSNSTVDSLLDVARGADDPTLRQSAYEHAEELILREAPFVPLHNPASFIGLRDEVVGLEMNPLGISTLAMEKLRFAGPRHDEERRSAGR
ncbi:MAG: ABC transporter substrate-binding protein [Candidatus Eisenbacteria bacterium]|uniref:ABC transporter substrate-binding protein n=1 Tax=Eiseniibacteriota bacterium TaxID=2212470 RepID=A0A538THT7_UNCEI|nr:MAG: ABC transporter substrate-binding protein [Candidatus Eisenbacteria bacterium]